MGVLTFFKGLESSFHFASPFTLSQFERPLSKGERDGIVRSLSVPSRSLSIQEHLPLSRRERDGTAQSHSVPSSPLSGQGQSDTLEKCIISLKEREG